MSHLCVVYCFPASFISGNHSILVYLELFLSSFDTALSLLMLSSIIISFLPLGLFPSSRPLNDIFQKSIMSNYTPRHTYFESAGIKQNQPEWRIFKIRATFVREFQTQSH